MRTLSFKYTKADGKESQRTLVVTGAPNKFYSGTDISELEAVDQVEYIHAVQQAHDDYLERLKVINDTFDLNHNFRQFSPERMMEVVEEEI